MKNIEPDLQDLLYKYIKPEQQAKLEGDVAFDYGYYEILEKVEQFIKFCNKYK